MAELRLYIPDKLVRQLQDKLGMKIPVTDMVEDALSLYYWAVNERHKGRLILSSDEQGEKMSRLSMPSLERIKAIG